ncbi:tetraacyldisaccharide 4'-kinase [Namhaeicola litoreus]|uniref:Tetraacyldisaccharide 4'-kinase n=1 Tax=Namhaeicola litoreus TaxID=1052145 RepID=A0ABW3Y4T8_9FLAO
MKKIRKILYPLSLVYDQITKARNMAYDKNVLNATTFDLPIIAVGNLNMGGTGKTPMIEYLIRLLKDEFRTAVLSRGYKRKSKGFQLATTNSTFEDIGDEPLQYHKKFDPLMVAVDADRVNGINHLLEQNPHPEVILLDDALQHRKVNPGRTILLTSYDKLYIDDQVLPAGELREGKTGAKRAQIIIVTKCPEGLTEIEQFEIAKRLKPELDQTVFFTSIFYPDEIYSKTDTIQIKNLKDFKVLLVTGIAKTTPLTNFLTQHKVDFEHIKFGDHHNFSENDIQKINQKFDNIPSQKKLILTTEKDFMRMYDYASQHMFFLPIQTKFIGNGKDFDSLILNYVRQNSRNS